MTQRAELADGTVLEFPDETTPEVIQNAVKKHMATQPRPQQGPPMPGPQDMEDLALRDKIRLASGGDSPGAGDLFKHAVTLGGQKPVSGLTGAINSVIDNGTGDLWNTLGRGWTAGTQGYDDMLQQARNESGRLGEDAEIAGSLVAGKPGTMPATREGLAKGWAWLGGLSGAARNADDWESAAKGGAAGAGMGLLAGKLIGKTVPKAARGAPTANTGPATDIPKSAFPLMEKQLAGGGGGRIKQGLATGLDVGADVLGSRAARILAYTGGATHGGPGMATAAAATSGGPRVLRAGADALRASAVPKVPSALADAMSPEVQRILQGPPSREKLAIMQTLGLSGSRGLEP